MKKIGKKLKAELNDLTHIMLGFDGFEVPIDYDFMKNENPRGSQAWNRAVIVYSHFKKDDSVLKYQLIN